MDKRYSIHLTRHAEASLREIARYIAYDLMEPNTAIRLIKSIRDEIASLAQMPNRIMLTPEEPWHSQGIHRMLVKNYFVYFWINEETLRVQVTDVIYARSDQASRLNEMPMDQ